MENRAGGDCQVISGFIQIFSDDSRVMVNPKLLSPESEFWGWNSETFGISEFRKDSGRLAR